MKKTTLYKLVKQALREVIRESKDLQLANKYLPKYEKLTYGEKSNITNEILREQREQAKKDSPIGLAQFSKAKIEKIYNFLVKNSKAKVSFKEISNDPLLKGINIDGLEVIYLQIVNLSLEEFKEALQELFSSSAPCNSIDNYGSINILASDCTSITIPQDFICCSPDNQDTENGPGDNDWITITSGGITYVVDGSFGCYTMPTGITQFTWAHFVHWWTGDVIPGNTATLGTGANYGLGTPNDYISFIDPLTNPGACGMGCNHPQSTNYDANNQGCDNGTGSVIAGNFDCCEFVGCGASSTNPPATNLTSIASLNGYQPEVNEENSYWIDSGTCTFPEGCYQPLIELNSLTQTELPGCVYATCGGGTSYNCGVCAYFPTNVTQGINLPFDGFVNASYPSNYVMGGTFEYVLTNANCNDNPTLCCKLVECACPFDTPSFDPSTSATTCNTSGVGNADYVGTLPGIYPSYILAHDQSTCTPCVYGCTDDTATNYDPTLNATCDDGTCIGATYGCTNAAACNYNSAANINQVSATDTSSPCILPDGCFDNSLGDITPNAPGENYGTSVGSTILGSQVWSNWNSSATCDDGSCIPCVYGCTDDTATNYDPTLNATCDNNSCTFFNEVLGCTDEDAFNYYNLANTLDPLNPCEYHGCTDDTAFNHGWTPNDGISLPGSNNNIWNVTATGQTFLNGIAVDDGTCIAVVNGCTDATAFNFNSLANVDDGTCIAVVSGCMDDLANWLVHPYNPDANVDCAGNVAPNGAGPFGDTSCCGYSEACWHPSQTLPNGNIISYSNYVCNDPNHIFYNLCDGNGDPDTTSGTFNMDLIWCEAIIEGCMDDGNYYFTSGVGSGVNGQANNYNLNADVPCTNCVVGPDGITMQTYDTGASTDNIHGCCCTYSPGCTDNTYIEYNISYQQDADSSIGAVYGVPCSTQIEEGCTHPGSTNYNPNANTEDPNDPCYYDGCIDDGEHYPPNATWLNGISPWTDYVCADTTPVSTPNLIDPTTGIALNYTVGEWLCGCGNNAPGGSTNPCTQVQNNPNVTVSLANPNALLNVEFKDTQLPSPYTDTTLYDAWNPNGEHGSCSGGNLFLGGGISGCTGDQYYQGDSTNNTLTDPGNYNLNAPADNGSCLYYGCEDPNALNYFCTLNPSLCDSSIPPEFIEWDPSNINQPGINGQGFGTLYASDQASIPFECEYPESYNCGNIDTNTGLSSTGCVNPGDGTGIYTSLGDCESDCTEISYNCSGDGTGCVDPGDGTGTYTLTTAFNASYFTPMIGGVYYGDPLGQCQFVCDDTYFECDSTYGCYVTVATSQPQGSFETLEDCQIKCTSYNCNEQTGCTPAPPNTIGTYTGTPNSLTPIAPIDQCEDECEECSMVTATKCLSKNITKDFTCLEIDGFNGDPLVPPVSQLPNTSISGPYGLEQYFKDTPSSADMFIKEQITNSTTWKVTTINNIFNTQPHTLRNSSTCYEGYNCGIEAGICYGTGTQIGSYTGPNAEEDCENNCSPISFECRNEVCSDPGDGSGDYNYATAMANGFAGDPQEECEGWGLSVTGQPGTGLPVGYNVLSPDFLNALNAPPGFFTQEQLKDEYGVPNCGPEGVCGNCFTGDTLITMPDNTTKRIDELKVDEIVKSEKETSQIQSIDVHEGKFDLYSINGSKHFVTEDHPFQTTDGWKAITPNKARKNHQIEAFVLKVGDILIKDNGEQEEITTLEKSKEKITTTTYNLRLDNEHVYYANNYLVHNGGVTRPIPISEDVVGASGTGLLPGWGKDPIGKPAGCDPNAINGCMDPTAINYNASATTDNGNCIYATFDCKPMQDLSTSPAQSWGECTDPMNGYGTYNELGALANGYTTATGTGDPLAHCESECDSTKIDFCPIGCKYPSNLNDSKNGWCCGGTGPFSTGQILAHDHLCCEFPDPTIPIDWNNPNNPGTGTDWGGTPNWNIPGGNNPGGTGTGYTPPGIYHTPSGNCFTGKTPIIMEDETLKRIDEIIVGDIVKSEINTSKVIGIDIHKEEEYTIYSINNSEAFVTAEHPFKTTTGWKAIDPLETFKKHGIESNVLEIGNILITKEGTEEVKSIKKSTKTINTVYNLQLDNEHVYYANGYLVHNNKFGGAWGIDDMPYPIASPNNTCPCGIFQGVMQYSENCCG